MTSHTEHAAALKATAVSACQLLPAATAVWMWLTSQTVDFWLGLSGLALIWVQIGYHVWKWRKEAKAKSNAKTSESQEDDDV